jgi:hypothetical protein
VPGCVELYTIRCYVKYRLLGGDEAAKADFEKAKAFQSQGKLFYNSEEHSTIHAYIESILKERLR